MLSHPQDVARLIIDACQVRSRRLMTRVSDRGRAVVPVSPEPRDLPMSKCSRRDGH